MSEQALILPEVLTETQLRFVDFIESKVKPTPDRKLRGVRDLKSASLRIGRVPQLVPVDTLELESYISIEKELPEGIAENPFPVPYRSFEASFTHSAKYGIHSAVYFDTVKGFQLAGEVGDIAYVKDEEAEMVVEALIQYDQAGLLIDL
jgi:hypothetical protein